MMPLLLLLQAAWADVEVPPRPEPAPAVEHGERLYGWNCLPCHGPDGKGDGPQGARLGLRPRDFTRGLFKLKSSPAGQGPFDEDLFRTISAGLPTRYMPAFGDVLPPEDRWAVIAYLRTMLKDVDLPQARVEAPREQGDAGKGAALFANACASCHGTSGRGDGPAAAALNERVPDLGRGEVEFLGGSRASDVYRALTTGLEGSAMPSFASLGASERRDLAAYVTTLYRKVPEGEALFFRRGCVACHTIGKGKHLGPDLAGVGARRSEAWLERWLRDPEAMARTDEDAKRLLAEYKIVMPDPRLPAGEREALARWLSTLR